jgi:hypothetical protein
MFFVGFERFKRGVSFSITVILMIINKHELKRKSKETRRAIK